jgi:hypothetical protein
MIMANNVDEFYKRFTPNNCVQLTAGTARFLKRTSLAAATDAKRYKATNSFSLSM